MHISKSSLCYRIIYRLLKSPRELRGSGFNSFAECLAACGNRSDYLDHQLQNAVVEDLGRARAARLPVMDDHTAQMLQSAILFCKTIRCGDKIRVLDFGGSAGVHQLGALQRFGDIFEWIVVETKPLVQAAAMAPVSNLHFTSDIEEAVRSLGGVDICLVSGSLQYCKEPAAIIGMLSTVRAACYLFRRTPFLLKRQSELRQRYWIQEAKVIHQMHMPEIQTGLLRTTRYPVSFLSLEDLTPLDSFCRKADGYSEGPLYVLKNLGETVEGLTQLYLQNPTGEATVSGS